MQGSAEEIVLPYCRVVADLQRDSPTAKDNQVRTRMRIQRTASTNPEVALRRELHRRGLRYRVTHPVPGRPRRTIDIAFTRAKVAVFVDGCFWHKCPEHFVTVKHNQAWWETKLDRNVTRDRETDQLLEESGWIVIRVWEHEDLQAAADTVDRRVALRLDQLLPGKKGSGQSPP